MKRKLTKDQQLDMEQGLQFYRDWDGDMAEDSIAASVHMHFHMGMLKSLFHKYEPGEDKEEQRLLLSDNYAFQQTYMRLIIEAAEEGAESHFQPLCEQAHKEYKGDNPCAYNVARAMADSVALLKKHVSKSPSDWIWRNLHSRQYANLPWSKTALKFFFHREVPYAGNNNTPNVSGTKIRANRKNIVFESTHVAAFKMVVHFSGKDDPRKDVNLYSIDTGSNGNPFQGHYFDMNSDHIYGRLRKMKLGRDLEGTKIKKLMIKPRSKQPPR